MVEKQTDMWVFNRLQATGYVNAAFKPLDSSVVVWAEKPNYPKIARLLAQASKKQTGNAGYPEFIVYDTSSNLVLVIEDKADVKKHVYKENLADRVADYAVNGALWYASFLKNDFDVIAIACSGTDPLTALIDTYAWKKGVDTFTNLNEHEILEIARYRDLLAEQAPRAATPENRRRLLSDARDINDFMHGRMGIIEHHRLHVLGSTLLALEDPVFKAAYSQYVDNSQIGGVLWSTIERKIKSTNASDKALVIDDLRSPLQALQRDDKEGLKGDYAKGTLHELIRMVDKILYNHYEDSELDLISIFFNVFLSYTTKGGSDLGIVLTPAHVTKLFVDLADISVDSRVLDPCAGTGGFLATAWRRIALDPGLSATEKEEFRSSHLFGVESESSIFTVFTLNMFLNKDGSSNLLLSDCFSRAQWMRDRDCNVGFINPPYSDKTYSEISFVELMLDSLLPSSTGIAIVPVNALSHRTKIHKDNTAVKKRILAKHTLLASIEMPKNLFFPKGVETVVLVFKTGKKHSGQTWMAKFNDGYNLLRHQGARTPTSETESLYAGFIASYRERVLGDYSFNHELKAEDQWVYTLFSDDDYEVLDSDLQRQVSQYVSYLYANQYL